MKKHLIPTEIGLPELPDTLRKNSFFRTVLAFCLDWGVVAGSVAISRAFPHPLVFAVAVFLIASRQHALFLMLHEGAHGSLCASRRWNDFLSNWLAAWPIGFSNERFRAHHWIHHQNTNTDDDPDWTRKVKVPEWHFPKAPLRFWKELLLPYCYGRGILEMLFPLKLIGYTKANIPGLVLYWGGITATLTYTGTWPQFLAYWILPLFLITPFFHKVRSMAEHFGMPHTHTLNGTRNIFGSPVQMFFFGPHNSSLHLVHHLYPNVPWYLLPNARAWLQTVPLYQKMAHENSGFFYPVSTSLYRDLVPLPLKAKETAEEKRAA